MAGCCRTSGSVSGPVQRPHGLGPALIALVGTAPTAPGFAEMDDGPSCLAGVLAASQTQSNKAAIKCRQVVQLLRPGFRQGTLSSSDFTL